MLARSNVFDTAPDQTPLSTPKPQQALSGFVLSRGGQHLFAKDPSASMTAAGLSKSYWIALGELTVAPETNLHEGLFLCCILTQCAPIVLGTLRLQAAGHGFKTDLRSPSLLFLFIVRFACD